MAVAMATARFLASAGAHTSARTAVRLQPTASCLAAAGVQLPPPTGPRGVQVRGVTHFYGTLEKHIKGSAGYKPKRVKLPYVDQLRAEHLLKVRMHIGHQKKKLNKHMGGTIYGFRHNVAIFDIQQTWQTLRTVFYGFAEMAHVRASFFLLSPNKHLPMTKLVRYLRTRYPLHGDKFSSLQMLGYADKKWVDGTFSNWKQTYAQWESIQRKLKARPNSKRLNKLANRLRGLSQVDLMGSIVPDFMLVFATDRGALHEAGNLDIPLFGMVDSNINPRPYLYPVFGNDDSYRSIQFMLDILARATEEGRKREHEAFATVMVSKLKEKLDPAYATLGPYDLNDTTDDELEDRMYTGEFTREEMEKRRAYDKEAATKNTYGVRDVDPDEEEALRLKGAMIARTLRNPGAAGTGLPVAPAGVRYY